MRIKAAPHKENVVVELAAQDEGLLRPLPFRLQRILTPTDFSPTAKKALQYALPFAKAFDAELLLLHVLQPFTVPAELGYMPPEMAALERDLALSVPRELEKLREDIVGAGIRSQVLVRQGAPWQEIVAAAQETNTDLIILSTHGRTGLPHVLMGSVAERVARHASCPVLVVREQERDFAPGAPA